MFVDRVRERLVCEPNTVSRLLARLVLAADRGLEVPLDGCEEVGLGFLAGARSTDLGKRQPCAADPAEAKAPTSWRHAPSGHDPTLGGHASPSIRSGTVA